MLKKLLPADALKRSNTAPTVVVIGPTTSGKSTLVYLLVNHKIVGFISVGIGEKSQTTIIPCNFAFDSRITKNEHFAIRIRKKTFDFKSVHIVILDRICDLFCSNAMEVEDTIDSIDKAWVESILEPKDASYHLSKIKDDVDINSLAEALKKVLDKFQNVEPDFTQRVKAKKRELAQQKLKIDKIREIVFEEVWEMIDISTKQDYLSWLNNIGNLINDKLNCLLREKVDKECINEFSVEKDDQFPYGATILRELFDPMQAYSLVISEMTLSCRPREELVNMAMEDVPLRFCLRDTMGLTQTGTDAVSIKNALDIALNCSPDSILLLFSLEERDDILMDSCKAIAEKLSKADKMDIPINVIFTKADRIIGNKVSIRSKGNMILTQNDYDVTVGDAINELNSDIEKYLEKIPRESVDWLSLRYLDEKMDPIQVALRGNALIKHFKPEGLYNSIDNIVKETQRRILPAGITQPIFITANKPDIPAVEIKLDLRALINIVNRIQDTLTSDKAVVNGYIIQTTYRLSGRSVSTYWKKLQIGLGHTTRANVYGNFSINMKAMLNNILTQIIPQLIDLYQVHSVHTIVSNLSGIELARLVDKLDINKRFSDIAFNDINPQLINGMTEEEKNAQILHIIFKDYFINSGKYYTVMDKVAFQLSYGNDYIMNLLNEIYYSSMDYDTTMRTLQKTFFTLFKSEQFADIIVKEIENAMTDLVCKMFITI